MVPITPNTTAMIASVGKVIVVIRTAWGSRGQVRPGLVRLWVGVA
jgi:hypothetical protein